MGSNQKEAASETGFGFVRHKRLGCFLKKVRSYRIDGTARCDAFFLLIKVGEGKREKKTISQMDRADKTKARIERDVGGRETDKKRFSNGIGNSM